jgi:hypothetical protein
MPISINGSGTITGINAGGLPDGVIQEADLATASVTADKIATNSVTTAKLGSAEQSGLCKAWVNFNGSGTVAIRASYNVSSITDNGVGLYKVNFTAAMPDTSYSNVGGAGHTSGDYSRYVGFNGVQTTSGVELRVAYPVTDGVTDSERICVAIFR